MIGMDLLPQFGTIIDIVVFDTDVHYLVCKLFVTECFSHHYHAFQAHKPHPQKYICVKQSHVYDHSVLAAYILKG